MANCKLCYRDAKLVKAHIIPKSFWEIDPTQALAVLTNRAGEYPKRSRVGVYDSTIVCDSCECSFSDYDSYAAQILLNDAKKFVSLRDGIGTIIAHVVRDIDYRLLKLFGIAVLWPAGASSHGFFRRVQLGHYFEQARDMLLRADPGAFDDFGITFAMWNGTEGPLFMDPFSERWGGVNYYRFYLGRYVAYIKVDRRPVPSIFSELVLRPDAPLLLVSRSLKRSKELPLMRRIFEQTQPVRRPSI